MAGIEKVGEKQGGRGTIETYGKSSTILEMFCISVWRVYAQTSRMQLASRLLTPLGPRKERLKNWGMSASF